MILFEKIRWRNFLSTGNSFTEIDFLKNRSTLIVGENGAGKSTLLDALSFVLYGRPFRRINKPLLVNSINGKGLLVELEFSIGKRKYLIKRGIKPSVFEIFQDENLINQNAEAREYQEMFEKTILKLNHKSFSQIVILGSASYVPFMQLAAAHRREVIEDLLDIQIFSTMNTLLKEKLQQNKTNLQEVDFNLRSTSDKIEMHKKHLEAMKTTNDDHISKKKQQIVDYENSIKTASKSINALTVTIGTLTKSIDDHDKVKRKLEKLSDFKRQLEIKLSKVQKEIEFFTDHDDCPTCRQGIDHDHKKDIVSRDNDQIIELNDGLDKLKDEVTKASERIDEINNTVLQISTLNNTVSIHNVEINTWNTFIQGLKEEIKTLSEDSTVKEDSSAELKEYKDALKSFIVEKEDLSNDKQVLDIASTLLRDSGIKTKIIKQYIPIMNKLINKYLASMDFFVNFELNENFEETIKSRYRDDFSYQSFSEGEKMRIDLSLLFTWRALAKLRNSASTNLLIMDEVFDSSLDSNGTDEFLKILYTLTNDTNVFIISHKGDTLFDKFENVIKFEKYKNFSRRA